MSVQEGIRLHQLGDFHGAIQEFEHALSQQKNSNTAHNLGIAYSRIGDTENAENAFRKAIRWTPGHIGSRNNLALLLQKKLSVCPDRCLNFCAMVCHIDWLIFCLEQR